jgi:single-strand DNA-binding protein
MHIGIFAGRVGRDADLKKLESGRELLEFSLAVTTGWGDKKATQWVKATVWGDRAEKLAPYILKGAALTINGRITSRAYSAKDGSLKSEILCDVLELTLQGNRTGNETPAPAQNEFEKRYPPTEAAPKTTQAPPPESDFNDDIPF